MRTIRLWCVLISAGIAQLAYAQPRAPWEAGVAGGFGWHSSQAVEARGASANAGIAGGIPVSGYIGHDMYRYLSGEIRYTFQRHDLKLSSGGAGTSFNAQSHAVHYDFVFHSRPLGADVRPYFAAGGGIKYFRGTGTEAPFQPLNQFAILTRTSEWLGMASAAGGVKKRLSERATFRVEIRYYLTPFPDQIIAPSSGAGLKGWMHNLVPMAGISYSF